MDHVTIYLIGLPGTGKYTIAKEIAKSGFRIADNQLANNPIFELIGYDGSREDAVTRDAWHAISQIRNVIFAFIEGDKQSNYVLTNVLLDDQGDKDLFDQVMSLAEKRNSIFVPVKLIISEEENARRIVNEDRKKRFKQIVPIKDYHSAKLITISHPNLLELDVSDKSAAEAARIILEHARKFHELKP